MSWSDYYGAQRAREALEKKRENLRLRWCRKGTMENLQAAIDRLAGKEASLYEDAIEEQKTKAQSFKENTKDWKEGDWAFYNQYMNANS